MSILMLKNVVLAFPALAEPQAIGDGEPAYGARFAIDPKSPLVGEIDAAMLAVAKQKWKEDGEAILDMLRSDKKVAFEKAAYRSKKTGKPYEGFEGTYSLGSRNAKTQPTVFDQYGAPVTTKSGIEQLLYSGCRVNAKVEFYAQDNSFGRRINCSLLGVMFAGDGERFGGGSAPASADDFAAFAAQPSEPEDVL